MGENISEAFEVFESVYYAQILKEKRYKLDDEKCIYVSYSSTSKEHRL